MTLEFMTAGESHGKGMIAIVKGLPYGCPVDSEFVNRQLARRMGGFGRSARMKIEKDSAEFLTGIRKGRTIGGPVTMFIKNSVANIDELGPIEKPRPGHADLVGMMKHGINDARDISERASARDTTARVAAGAFAQSILLHFGVKVVGFVRSIGSIHVENVPESYKKIVELRDASDMRMTDKNAEAKAIDLITKMKQEGDTLGGSFEVRAFGVPPGLGACYQWSEKLDGKLAQYLMSIQTVKAVEIGEGLEGAKNRGSDFQDEIIRTPEGIGRPTNRAGGLEGGMTNGEPVVVRCFCKPISTLRRPLKSINMATGEEVEATYERSDVCVVPAASVVGETTVAFVILAAMLEKFGGDTFVEVQDAVKRYRQTLKNRGFKYGNG